MTHIAIVGAGPAGLMAAEAAALHTQHATVQVYDAMPTVGRKLLLAGIGGLNITHAEDFERFATRYGDRASHVRPWLEIFGPQAVRDWVHGLGLETFVGSSQRVFPGEMKAAPLLRNWLARLRRQGVRIHTRHRWLGWSPDGGLRFASPAGVQVVRADATVLALGGGSWKKLGSDGAWLPLLVEQGIACAPLHSANCGFNAAQPWSEHLQRFAGHALKSVALHFTDHRGRHFQRPGECVLTQTGIEGSLVYAASAWLRDDIAAQGYAQPMLDLLPGWSEDKVLAQLRHPRGSKSLSGHLTSRLKLRGVKAALLYEVLRADQIKDPEQLARAIKALPLRLGSARPIDEAISSAGGVRLEALDGTLMARDKPGLFCAGEMLDWEAPTGGYLLTACWASGKLAGRAAAHFAESAAARDAAPGGPRITA